MTAISEFTGKLNAFFDRQDTAITGIKGDLQFLKDTIAALQASSGQVTPEDQALIDAAEARVDAATTKVEGLDAETPPVAPPQG